MLFDHCRKKDHGAEGQQAEGIKSDALEGKGRRYAVGSDGSVATNGRF